MTWDTWWIFRSSWQVNCDVFLTVCDQSDRHVKHHWTDRARLDPCLLHQDQDRQGRGRVRLQHALGVGEGGGWGGTGFSFSIKFGWNFWNFAFFVEVRKIYIGQFFFWLTSSLAPMPWDPPMPHGSHGEVLRFLLSPLMVPRALRDRGVGSLGLLQHDCRIAHTKQFYILQELLFSRSVNMVGKQLLVSRLTINHRWCWCRSSDLQWWLRIHFLQPTSYLRLKTPYHQRHTTGKLGFADC